MQRLIALAVVVVAILVIFNYVKTGEFGLLPKGGSPEEKELARLEQTLMRAQRDMDALVRAGATAPGEVAPEVETKKREIEELQREIAELKKKIAKQGT